MNAALNTPAGYVDICLACGHGRDEHPPDEHCTHQRCPCIAPTYIRYKLRGVTP